MNLFDNLLLNYFSLSQMCINNLDTFISKNTIEIKQILLHHPDFHSQDITTQFPSNFTYPDISMFIKDIKFNHNLNSHKFCLEIIYYWQEQIYRIVYPHSQKITFPPYSINELIKDKQNTHYPNGILFATYLDQDLTDLVKAYAGPKGNFYEDIGLKLTLEDLKLPITYRGFLVKNGASFVLTDNYAEDYTFNDNDVIKI